MHEPKMKVSTGMIICSLVWNQSINLLLFKTIQHSYHGYTQGLKVRVGGFQQN